MRRTPRSFHSYYLFPAIVLLFVAQPVVATLFAAASQVLVPPLALTLVAAIWSLERAGLWLRVALGLGLALLVAVAVNQVVASPALVLAALGLLGALSALCAARGIRWLFQSQITLESLLTAMSVYLLIGITFGIVAVGFYLLDPEAYHGVTPGGRSAEVGDLLYFSIGTLTTAAYGDITPVHPLARLLSNLEAVVGQMYVAVLVAMLVSGYATSRRK